MAGYPKLGDDELYEVATYLAMPATRPEIHAEMHPNRQASFESEYAKATKQYPLPPVSNRQPYYIWRPDVNKYGWQLRIYFARTDPEPPIIRRLYTDFGKWYGKQNRYRINHSQLVLQLFECGFVLGDTQDPRRIETFMRQRFPVAC